MAVDMALEVVFLNNLIAMMLLFNIYAISFAQYYHPPDENNELLDKTPL